MLPHRTRSSPSPSQPSSLRRAWEKTYALGLGMCLPMTRLPAVRGACDTSTDSSRRTHAVKLFVQTAAYSGVCEVQLATEESDHPLTRLVGVVELAMGVYAARRASLKFFVKKTPRWAEVESRRDLMSALAAQPICLALLVVDAADPATINPMLDSGDYYPDLDTMMLSDTSTRFCGDARGDTAHEQHKSTTDASTMEVARQQIIALEMRNAALSAQLSDARYLADRLSRQLAGDWSRPHAATQTACDADTQTDSVDSPSHASEFLSTPAQRQWPVSKLSDVHLAHQHVRRRCTLIQPTQPVRTCWSPKATPIHQHGGDSRRGHVHRQPGRLANSSATEQRVPSPRRLEQEEALGHSVADTVVPFVHSTMPPVDDLTASYHSSGQRPHLPLREVHVDPISPCRLQSFSASDASDVGSESPSSPIDHPLSLPSSDRSHSGYSSDEFEPEEEEDEPSAECAADASVMHDATTLHASTEAPPPPRVDATSSDRVPITGSGEDECILSAPLCTCALSPRSPVTPLSPIAAPPSSPGELASPSNDAWEIVDLHE